ncbi:unnamed protein product [Haemonchus placei]|uniref:Transposase n=1 Tax=Haemonchus placei TaxID=6290 RepID=A0A0N4X7R6_HAEPC|nr:unnamed protein product [Haemonchus placei]
MNYITLTDNTFAEKNAVISNILKECESRTTLMFEPDRKKTLPSEKDGKNFQNMDAIFLRADIKSASNGPKRIKN